MYTEDQLAKITEAEKRRDAANKAFLAESRRKKFPALANITNEERGVLRRVHDIRQDSLWGRNAPESSWPQTDADWRQTFHGAPWDTNVAMAYETWKLATRLRDEGLLP